jgi:hypothetical protein
MSKVPVQVLDKGLASVTKETIGESRRRKGMGHSSRDCEGLVCPGVLFSYHPVKVFNTFRPATAIGDGKSAKGERRRQPD